MDNPGWHAQRRAQKVRLFIYLFYTPHSLFRKMKLTVESTVTRAFIFLSKMSPQWTRVSLVAFDITLRLPLGLLHCRQKIILRLQQPLSGQITPNHRLRAPFP